MLHNGENIKRHYEALWSQCRTGARRSKCGLTKKRIAHNRILTKEQMIQKSRIVTSTQAFFWTSNII